MCNHANGRHDCFATTKICEIHVWWSTQFSEVTTLTKDRRVSLLSKGKLCEQKSSSICPIFSYPEGKLSECYLSEKVESHFKCNVANAIEESEASSVRPFSVPYFTLTTVNAFGIKGLSTSEDTVFTSPSAGRTAIYTWFYQLHTYIFILIKK